jgi:hypothetical protein
MGQQRTYSWEGTAADGAVTGERRTESVSDQPGSSGDPQFVVCVVAAVSRARGSGVCTYPGFSRARQKLIDRTTPKNRLPISSGCVGNRPSNEGLCDRRSLC